MARPTGPVDPLTPGGDPVTPRPRFYRRYWDTYNRPYSGCRCLWIIIIIAFIIWIISWGGGYHWWGGRSRNHHDGLQIIRLRAEKTPMGLGGRLAVFVPLAYLPNFAPERSITLTSLTLFWSFFALTVIICATR